MSSIAPNSKERHVGRAKGTPNRLTTDLKMMIEGALWDVGGQAYLARQAEENPAAFMALLGKILPKVIIAEAPSEVPTIEMQRKTVLDALHKAFARVTATPIQTIEGEVVELKRPNGSGS